MGIWRKRHHRRHHHHLHNPAVAMEWSITTNGVSVRGGNPMNVTMTKTQKFTATITVLDAQGNSAKFNGPPVWTASEATAIALKVAADGMSADVLSNGVEGTFSVTVQVDSGQNGTPGPTISSRLDVIVGPGGPPGTVATTIVITTTDPVEQ